METKELAEWLRDNIRLTSEFTSSTSSDMRVRLEVYDGERWQTIDHATIYVQVD